MTPWGVWWLCYVCAGVTAEVYVVACRERSDRLSQNVWLAQNSLPGDPLIWRSLTAALLILLAYHLSFGPRH